MFITPGMSRKLSWLNGKLLSAGIVASGNFTLPDGKVIPPGPDTRFSGNIVALTIKNKEMGLNITSDTLIPNWYGEKMDIKTPMPNFLIRCTLLLILTSLNPVTARAWGPEGHVQVGLLALQGLDPIASSWIQDVLGTDDSAAINRACNWPDQVRETPAWVWSASQHYVNIPRSASHYDRQRDCPDGLCVTEAIKKYADQLGDPRLDKRKQWEAFAWLCHLVGDLHQPLHAGYWEDRGGNNIQVSYKGEAINLHRFWDRTLIQEHLKPHGNWQKPALAPNSVFTGKPWNPAEIDAWTDESHTLVAEAAYPPGKIIHADFAENTWLLIRQQWLRAGQRLARILNAVVGEAEIEFNQ